MPRKQHEINPECGKRLKSWLDHVEISAKAMCAAINYTPQYISDVMTGKKRLTPELADTISKISKIPAGLLDKETGKLVDLEIPVTERVRSEYLLLKDDYMTISDVIIHKTGNKSDRIDLVFKLLELHGYAINDITSEMPTHAEDGMEWKETTYSFAKNGRTRFFKSNELMNLIQQIDDYVEMLSEYQFKILK